MHIPVHEGLCVIFITNFAVLLSCSLGERGRGPTPSEVNEALHVAHLFSGQGLLRHTESCAFLQAGHGKWFYVRFYGPEPWIVRPFNVIKVAPFNHPEALRELENEISVMQIAESKGLAGEVVPMCMDCGWDPQVCAAFFWYALVILCA
jgi:hypothetical protein